MINLTEDEIFRTPFPAVRFENFIDPDTYVKLAETYPDVDQFAATGNKEFQKYSLSNRNNPDTYFDFLNSCPEWREFADEVSSKDFADSIVKYLKGSQIDLALDGFSFRSDFSRKARKSLIGRLRTIRELRTRFEFSALPVNGGGVVPHTDSPSKVITLVISMIKEGEWDGGLGGGTELYEPVNDLNSFNFVNKPLPFKEMKLIHRFPFVPNQCVLFIKTFNSWHGVPHMKGEEDDKRIRKTITLVFEECT